MVEGNIGKFESQISFILEENFLLNACVLLRSESIVATLDPLLSLALLRDWQRLSLGELVDGR
jgi:hypothetical protein